MMFPHPEEFARNCIDIISVKDDLAVMLYPNKSIRIIEAYSSVFKYAPHYPVTDHPRKDRKTRPVVYL